MISRKTLEKGFEEPLTPLLVQSQYNLRNEAVRTTKVNFTRITAYKCKLSISVISRPVTALSIAPAASTQ